MQVRKVIFAETHSFSTSVHTTTSPPLAVVELPHEPSCAWLPTELSVKCRQTTLGACHIRARDSSVDVDPGRNT